MPAAQDYLAHVDRDTYVQVCRALNRVTLGLPLDRPATDAEIAAMARRDRERGA